MMRVALSWLAESAPLMLPALLLAFAATPSGAEEDHPAPAVGGPAKPASVERVAKMQAALRQAHLDGWLLFDFRGSNPIASRVLLLPEGQMATRRWFYFIPAEGEPVKIVHAIEASQLDTLPGTPRVYGRWEELLFTLRETLKGRKQIAMEYSPEGAIPYVSRVDAGTVEMVRKAGPVVVTSADLVQTFEAVWTPAQREQHERAAVALRTLVDEAWTLVARRTAAAAVFDERSIQQHLADRMRELGLEFDHPPIVAIGPNAALPHYDVPQSGSSQIKRGDLLLIDIWAKVREEGAVYADITWMGQVSETVEERYAQVFSIVAAARDAAFEFVKKSAASGKLPMGWQVDDACRAVIQASGHGLHYIHRTGHSIGVQVHGDGANLDNYETRDERRLLPGTCFSIEPGIYVPGEFGMRSEIDVCLDGTTPVVTGGPAQTAIVPILAGRATR